MHNTSTLNQVKFSSDSKVDEDLVQPGRTPKYLNYQNIKREFRCKLFPALPV